MGTKLLLTRFIAHYYYHNSFLMAHLVLKVQSVKFCYHHFFRMRTHTGCWDSLDLPTLFTFQLQNDQNII